MKRLPAFIFFVFISSLVIAQENTVCNIDNLYALKTGMTKEAVSQLMQQTEQQTLSDEKNTNKEIIIYKPASENCFTGRNTKLQLEFINNKLSCAFISTQYAKPEYNTMMNNLNALRNTMQQLWNNETAFDIPVENTYCKGFDYTNNKKNHNTSQTISLQFFDATADEQNAIYILELVLVNTPGKRIAGKIFY